MNLTKRITKLIQTVKQELDRVVTRVRVFSNCLLLYFENGSPRFYSKKGEDWGATGSDYLVEAILKALKQAYYNALDAFLPVKKPVEILITKNEQFYIRNAI